MSKNTRSLTNVLAASCSAVVLMVSASAPLRAQSATPKSPTTVEKVVAPVNLNTAGSTELQTLPGVGAATAGRILEYRQKNGAFKKIEDLMNVRGIGEKTFLKLKPMITVAPPKVHIL